MKVFISSLLLIIGGFNFMGCGPFLSSKKKPKTLPHTGTFQIARANNASTADVTTQSTLPLRMWEGGIANLTTMSLAFNKLVLRLGTSLSVDELRKRNPRITLQFGSTSRTQAVQISETGSHEVQFLNLNAILSGNINQERPDVKNLTDIKSLPRYARVLIMRMMLNGKPLKEGKTTFTLTLVKAETETQLPPGTLLTEENQTPHSWPLNSPGFNVTWLEDNLVK